MSAFVVDKRDIDLLVSALIEFDVWMTLDGKNYGRAGEFDPNEVGRLLWLENVRSVTRRYNLDVTKDRDRQDEHAEYVDDIANYAFRQYCDLRPGPVAKLVACYEYQSCEHDEWEASAAHDIMQRLRAELLRKLPGYEAGPWGVNSDEDVAKVCNPAVVSLVQIARRKSR